tara:strand:+ start:6283 stop:6546 length:264 start_codon:yes stop_codon:yes gene_type:complete
MTLYFIVKAVRTVGRRLILHQKILKFTFIKTFQLMAKKKFYVKIVEIKTRMTNRLPTTTPSKSLVTPHLTSCARYFLNKNRRKYVNY